MTSGHQADPKPIPRRGLILTLIGLTAAVVGAVIGGMIGRTVKRSAIDLPWPDALALLVAGVLVSCGLVVLAMSFSRRALAANMGLIGEVTRAEARLARVQAPVMLLAGVLMAIPTAVALWRWMSPEVAYAAAVALFGVQTVWNVMLWRRMDEHGRRMVSDVGALCFWILQDALFLYAAAERLGLAPRVDAWTLTAVMMAAYFIVSTWVGVRRSFG